MNARQAIDGAFEESIGARVAMGLAACGVGGCATQPGEPIDITHLYAQDAAPKVPEIKSYQTRAEAVLAAHELAERLHGEVGMLNGATGSMVPIVQRRPYLQVLVKVPPRDWQPGQFVVYRNAGGNVVTHCLEKDGDSYYAKGVGNSSADPGFIDERNYLGTVVALLNWNSE